MTTSVQYAPGTPSISDFMDVEDIFEQYFNDGASIAEAESKGSISAQTTPPSDPPSANSLKTTDSSPPSTTRSAAASPQVSSMPYFDESQMEGLWDHFALEDTGGFRENTTQGENGYMYSTASGVSIPALPSVTMATIQPNQVTHQPPQFFNPQKYQQQLDKSTIHSPLQTLVHGYHPSNTQAVHGQVTPVEDNQQTGIPVFPPDIFNNVSFAGRMDSPPQSRRGSTSPQQEQSSRRSRKNSKASRDADEQSAQEAKRRRFLERNRVAASKCRQKKKEWMQNLEETARTAQHNSKYLQAAVVQLKDELLILKQELLKHHGCDCVKIRTYLMQEAEKVVVDQQKKGNGIVDTPTPVKPRQLSIAESEMSEMSDMNDMNALGEELDMLADEAMDDTIESKEEVTAY